MGATILEVGATVVALFCEGGSVTSVIEGAVVVAVGIEGLTVSFPDDGAEVDGPALICERDGASVGVEVMAGAVDGDLVALVTDGATVGPIVSGNVGDVVRIGLPLELLELFVYVGIGVFVWKNVGAGISVGRPLDDFASAPLLLDPFDLDLLPPFPFPLECARIPFPLFPFDFLSDLPPFPLPFPLPLTVVP